MVSEHNYSIKGDRALSDSGEDKLGFLDVAKRIATSLVDRASESGLVIGIEGSWGSGKSSLLFLIANELKKLPEAQRPSVINFQPWLIGNRDALITSLFGDLSKQLDQVALDAGDPTQFTVTKAKEASEALRSFMSGLSKTGSAIEVAGEATGVTLLKWIGQGLKATGEIADNKRSSPPLSDLKEKLVNSLRALQHRFIITIDDVDRLEPGEVIEVLRLVRSVADLPNVIYLLCYDSDILTQSIKKAIGIENGSSFLEKIVQLTVMVPRPGPLQLRQWFSDELYLIATAKNEDELSRLKQVIDYEGEKHLRTPRSVARVLDAIRFFLPPLREMNADLADLVWLNLIKEGNPALYRWIEEYSGIAALLSLGTLRVDDSEKAQMLSKLLATAKDGHFDDVTYRYIFADQLPGIKVDRSNKDRNLFSVYERVTDKERGEAIQNVRLASPDHYRLYFALAGPTHALTQNDFAAMWDAVTKDKAQTGDALLQLHRESASGALTKADLFLERIRDGSYKVLTPEQCQNLLLALADVMDKAYRLHPFDDFWINSIWDRAKRLVPLLLSILEPQRRAAVITAIFSTGASIAWLTSLFRDEIFAHGRYGSRPRPESAWILTNIELDQITNLMLERYRAMSGSDIFASPHPSNLLFAWLQGGDAQGPRQVVEVYIASDEGLVGVLEKLATVVDSSNRGRYIVLKQSNLVHFMDYKNVRQRIEGLKSHSDLGARASLLAAAFEDAEGSE